MKTTDTQNILLLRVIPNFTKKTYPRVTSFDALKQSTGIYAHLITFYSGK